MTYNGWSNYETWLTQLHMLDDITASDINGWDAVTADEVRAYVEETLDQSLGKDFRHGFVTRYAERYGFAGDIIRNFMSAVNWRELAEHITAESATEED